ncbi:hypothetical protein HC248_01164 [Polaromonas vacuolata]|uniref:Uncharacterized protein n=1 Tax=Polaromonas vacuolata TaxID=37448 RepID=A0A6H2H7S0_9BURK|nr:hypothetical protein [Polaromonas vacuolata]QJC55880.1 hypothetical protein HC248_01164 [Polaromonas vacuolata]
MAKENSFDGIKTFVNHLFKLPLTRTQPRSLGGRNAQFMQSDQTPGGIRRRLIQVVMRDLMRRNGLPQNWVECHIKLIDGESQTNKIALQLVLKHWDERLIHYLPALENELTADIKRFEPKASEWLEDISWQLAPVNACPYKFLPNKKVWLEPTPKPAYEVTEPTATHAKITDREALSVAANLLLRNDFPKIDGEDEFQSDFASLSPNISITEAEIDMMDLQRLFEIRDEALSSAVSNRSSTSHQQAEPAKL